MPDFTTKLELISKRGTLVGAEDLIERIEAQLAGDPLVVVTQRRKGILMTKTDQSVPTKTPGPGRGPAWALAAFVAVLAVAGLYMAFSGEEDQIADQVTLPQTTTLPPSTTFETGSQPIDTSTWNVYESARYGFTIGYPADWTVVPASHDWTMAGDAEQWQSTGQEVFLTPEQDVRVSVWSADSGPTADTPEALEEWVNEYCEQTDDFCPGVDDQAIPLCNERRDCHPGVMVPYVNETQAFFARVGTDQRMVVVAVWRPEYDPSVAPYGGARRLLEAFLSTMDVCPAPDQALRACPRTISEP